MTTSPPIIRQQRRLAWLMTVPGFGVIALVAAILMVIRVSHNNELDIQSNGLIADVLWLEQNLNFRFTRNEEQLQRLALDLGNHFNNRQLFRLQAEHLLNTSPEILQILVLSSHEQARHGLPSLILPQPQQAPSDLLHNGFDQARRMGKTVYSPPYSDKPGEGQVTAFHPIFSNEGFAGVVLVVYSINNLLRDAVPWWFAEKYSVRVNDDNGSLLATKSNVGALPSPGLDYDVTLDPPGNGIRLTVQAHPKPTRISVHLLTGLIVLLALGVLLSLWVLRQQMRRRIKTELALRAEHAFRKAMEDSLTVGMRARDLQGRIIYVNAAFCRMTGFSQEELVGRGPPLPYWAPEHMEEALARHREVMAGEVSPKGFEIGLMKKHGERFEALIFEAPLIDGEGQHTGWMASFIDITERNRAEEWYRQQQEKLQFTARLVTMGEMASTLAHELNQPLSAITSYATGCMNLIQSGQAHSQDLSKPLGKLVAQAQRAGAIIRRVHDFVRRREPRREQCDLNAIVEDAVGLMEATAKTAGAKLLLQLSHPLPPVPADRLMLEQLTINLIKNGLEAMKDTPLAHKQLTITSQGSNKAIQLSIEDQGVGISPELGAKLFTPFLSTKEEGMGMGLNICRSIVELHRGRLWFETAPAGGTIFHFSLPLEYD